MDPTMRVRATGKDGINRQNLFSRIKQRKHIEEATTATARSIKPRNTSRSATASKSSSSPSSKGGSTQDVESLPYSHKKKLWPQPKPQLGSWSENRNH